MGKYIIALDEGTTSCRAMVIDKRGNIVSKDQIDMHTITPKPGWVEQDAYELWSLQRTVLIQSVNKKNLNPADIESIGITNQRETVIVWDKKTGLPVYNAIIWQDRRTAAECEKLAQKYEKVVKEKTGLIISPYFSATKIKWILDHTPNGYERARKGELMFGNVNTWLIYKLTNGRAFFTDATNASRTLLYNINTNKYDEELLEIFDIPREILPEVKKNSDFYGKTFPGLFSRNDNTRIPITSSVGDQHAALFGQLCLEKGETKVTYGTGCFILSNTGTQPVYSNNGLITTIAFQYNNKTYYALEGSVLVAGAAINWLKDGLRLIYSSNETEWYAGQADDDSRLYVVPSFSGLGAPYWDSDSRGAVMGIDFTTKREHLVRATLESLAYQANDVIEAIAHDIGQNISTIKADGGAINNKYLMQFQSDISQCEVVRPDNVETTAMGAAFLAGLYTGFWKDTDEIKMTVTDYTTVQPKKDPNIVRKLLKGWKVAVSKTFGWLKEIGESEND